MSNIITTDNQKRNWDDRFQKFRDDRIILARFLAICLILVGVVNVIPAGLFWNDWSSQDHRGPIPRWVWMQVFIALLHLVYAVYLLQIPDWASLRAVAFAMLAIAMIFGIVASGLMGSSSENFVPRFMQLSGSLIRQARLWCVAMLCVATLASYLGGRESARWQRAEKLMLEMKDKSEQD